MPQAIDPYSLNDLAKDNTWQANQYTQTEQAIGYRLACPDVVEVVLSAPQHTQMLACIDLNGRLQLGDYGQPVVAGKTLAEARHAVALAAQVDVAHCTVRLAEPRSQWLSVVGPERGVRRQVVFQGNETLADLIQRVQLDVAKGKTREVVLLRPNVAEGRPAEVFRARIKPHDDPSALHTIHLQAEDQIFFSEPFRSRIGDLVPRWLRSSVEWFTLWAERQLTPP